MDIFPLEQVDLLGNSSIGIFGMATDMYALLPHNVKPHVLNLVQQTLKVPTTLTSMVSSHLIGLFCVGNTHHLLLPAVATDEEYLYLRGQLKDEIEVNFLESKISALGNTIVASDKLALVHPEFSHSERQAIQDSLDVEVLSRTLMGNPLVGSLIFRSARGILGHPNISDQELGELTQFFQGRADVTTVNRGTPYPRLGIIANSKGAVVGSDCTGPEMMRIFEVLS